MATMPIEIIVQDKETPVVPNEDGTNNTETNITVPDTGTISSNGKTSSSASSIILPAILLVLAIGSIVAILIHKYQERKKDKISKKEKLAAAISSTIAALAATVLVGNLVLPATKAATSDATDTITPAEDKVSIVLTRDGGSAETSIESTATITSASDFGYKVLLSMTEGAETANLYLDGDIDSEYFIAPVEAVDEENATLTDNTWGYALTEDGEYSAVPLLVNAATVAQGDEPVEDENLSIYYGVKVSSDLPAGAYSGGDIEYTLELVPRFPDTLVYMQDMTHEICSNTPTPGNKLTDPVPTATLIDSRDNKTYTIAKLADGKCWMTQNLDLDMEVPAEDSIVYDSTNTNLSANTTWEPERATIAKDNLSSNTWRNDSNNPYSYDPGDVYYYTSGSDADDIKYESLEACIGANHTEADCKHYHAGNYYNWTATIASNDSSGYTEQYSNTISSICPKGWRLPKNRNADSWIDGNEFAALVSSYEGIVNEPYAGGYFNLLPGGFDAIRVAPLWLIRPGYIENYSLSYNGERDCYWSSTNYIMGNAYAFAFTSSSIYPAGDAVRGRGASVRCIAE